MQDAVMYLGSCVLGYFCAFPFRTKKHLLIWLVPMQNLVTLLLIFAMGLRVGSNEEAVRNIGAYGVYAFLFTAVILAFSLISVSLLRRLLGFDRHGKKQAAAEGDMAAAGPEGGRSNTVKMLVLVSVGIAAGYLLVKRGMTGADALGGAAAQFITVGLCLLLFLIGLDLGQEGKIVSDIKSVGGLAVLIPLAIAAGTVAGSVLCSLFLPLSLRESLAIGCGFGWYSLSSGIILDAGYIAAGTVSFMHNVMRELFSVVLIPVVAKGIGYLETVSLPGSCGMDVGLPIVARSTNASTAVCSFVSGFMLSLSVPIIVPLFL